MVLIRYLLQLQVHKAFVDAEIAEVQQEAAEINPGWEQHIWPQAMSYHSVSLLPKVVYL